MSYGLYIGKEHTADGHAWLAGYGDEPSSHWLEIVPRRNYPPGATMPVGVEQSADLPGVRSDIPQIAETARHLRVSYTYYMGVPAPITNGGLNEHGVAVRDIWSTSRDELIAMTPKDQRGPNYSDLAVLVMERATTAREGVELIGRIIAEHGESTYGGNSHIIADPDEAWVVIQFAGGKGLWAAERLGLQSIRASRPGYIELIPVDEPEHPDFLYSSNLVSFATAQGWYSDGPFNVNAIYGDGKGRWEGVRWIEDEMATRAARCEKIGLADVMWALRTHRLTGDTAGYGQVVPLVHPEHNALRMMWHAPIGAIAAPFSPVFIGQTSVPPEFDKHRYLTTGEDHRFMDTRKEGAEGTDTVSVVDQTVECSRSAVAECKRLLYLILQNQDQFINEIGKAFEEREIRLTKQTSEILRAAQVLMDQNQRDLASSLLTYFSQTELLDGLRLVEALSASMEARLRAGGAVATRGEIRTFDQIW